MLRAWSLSSVRLINVLGRPSPMKALPSPMRAFWKDIIAALALAGMAYQAVAW